MAETNGLITPNANTDSYDIVKSGGYLEHETYWVERFDFLERRGYLLRARYRPGWAASWTPDDSLLHVEEAITPRRDILMDATRVAQGDVVMLKKVPKLSPEIQIGRLLSDEEIRHDPRNHGIPLLEVIEDEVDPENAILVLPLLRPIDHPPVASVRECVDFVYQTLEGLAFLHELQVAHRDCAWSNIMMDARAMFPQGWHAMQTTRLPDGRFIFQNGSDNPSRTAAGEVRYYFIDFGISSLGDEWVLGVLGQERAPELSNQNIYSPYKVDVYVLGMVYQRYLVERHSSVDFLLPLVEKMTSNDPQERPTAAQAMAQFAEIRSSLGSYQLSQRLHPLDKENAILQFVRDTIYRIQEAFWRAMPKRKLEPFKLSAGQQTLEP